MSHGWYGFLCFFEMILMIFRKTMRMDHQNQNYNVLSVKKKAHTSQENWWVQTDVSSARNIQIEG